MGAEGGLTATGGRALFRSVSGPRITSIDDKHVWLEMAGQKEKAQASYWRGEHTNFHPNDAALETTAFIQDYLALGLMPAAPPIGPHTNIVAFGSCFAAHIRDYLAGLNFRVLSRDGQAYVSLFGDGMVNTFALRQQFEWAWEGREPALPLWQGYDRRELGYDDEVRRATRAMFDAADIFIITLGLSEVWFDEPTGEVFWRAVPFKRYDAERHKFRVATHAENLENLRVILKLIRSRRPSAKVVFTLSPVPLTATFRPLSCLVADSASKAILRSAVDELVREAEDPDLFYFPSYEVVTRLFRAPYMEERRHVHLHVVNFNMQLFERYYCETGMTDQLLQEHFRRARQLDDDVVQKGHWAVARIHVTHHSAPE